MSEKINIINLANVFPNFLCVTNHGTVATECAFLNLMCIVASNSQYTQKDTFVNFVKSENDFRKILKKWQEFKKQKVYQRKALFSYSYVNNIKSLPLYDNHLFKDYIDEKISSSNVDEWIKRFIDSKGKEGYSILLDSSYQYINKLNNDFKEIITND